MKEEVKKILKMIEEGHITAEEGERLMEALDNDRTSPSVFNQEPADPAPRLLKIRVVEKGVNKINVKIPIRLVEIGLKIGSKIGPKFAPEAEFLEDIDFDELMEAIRDGVRGKLVDIEDGGDKVEIFVE